MFRFSWSEFLDKFALIIAMFVFLLMGFASIRNVRSLDTLSRQDAPMLSESKVDVDTFGVERVQASSIAWSKPESQSRGEDWVFDVFTPPVLYYNPASREFTVTTPELSITDAKDPWKAFEIELVEVRQRPYRLQLVGYAGEDGNYRAYFEFLNTNELLIAREGKLLVEAGVKVLSFDVKQMEVEQEGSMPVFEKVGVARLLDYETNEEVFLTNLETKIFSDLEARVRSIENGDIYVVREGSQVEVNDGSSYVIGSLSHNPPEAMVTKISVDGDKRLSKLLKALEGHKFLNQESDADNAYSPFAIRPKIVLPKPKS